MKEKAVTLKELRERYRKQSQALAETARQLADEDASEKFSSLDIHNFCGSAPVVIQTFATPPGTDLAPRVALPREEGK